MRRRHLGGLSNYVKGYEYEFFKPSYHPQLFHFQHHLRSRPGVDLLRLPQTRNIFTSKFVDFGAEQCILNL